MMVDNNSRNKVLCVGVCTLDIVQVCANFPLEDSDERCLESYWQRGGNASNNCSVLSQLGVDCEFLGTLSKKEHLTFLVDDFRNFNINIDNCIYYEDFNSPLSTVILNRKTGSRTILHTNPNLPGLTIDDFKKIDICSYKWIHFEGRNIEQTRCMMEFLNEIRAKNDVSRTLTISVDIEKCKQELQGLIPLADVIFVSKDFALYEKCTNMVEAVRHIAKLATSGATVVCAWGEHGAAAYNEKDNVVTSPAYTPNRVIDTLGAGDTFCAAVITGLITNNSLQDSLILGCKIAGAKVGIKGYKGLNEVYVKIK